MRQLLLTTVLFLVLTSCNGRKLVESAINQGNYDQAINDVLKKLENNKDNKRKQDYIVMLEDAYHKVLKEDLRDVVHLKKDGNPEQYKAIYETYLDLEARQNAIKRVMPLQISGRNLDLKFNDYTSEIVDYRYRTSDYLIGQGITLLDSEDKYNARQAYDIFNYVERINPNFEDTRNLITEAHDKGTDYVMVSIENQTTQIIPQQLEADLLNFDTYGLNEFWTVYHAQHISEVNYDFEMQLQLKRINISPEQVNSRQVLKQKNIVDGWEYQTDTHGDVMVDSLGNNIKIDKIVTIRARYFEVNQFKSTQVIADVVYTDLRTNQALEAFAIDSEFVFEHFYATVRGDQRTLNRQEHELTRNRRLLFPSDAQMVYDTGEDIKLKLKDIISSYRIKRG
jgi:tetratricopeptide (TPR) repeat protein